MVRPNAFMSNALRWKPPLDRGDLVRGPWGDIPVATIDPADVGEIIAIALTQDGHDAATPALRFAVTTSPAGGGQIARLVAIEVPTALGLSPKAGSSGRPRGTWRAPSALRAAGLMRVLVALLDALTGEGFVAGAEITTYHPDLDAAIARLRDAGCEGAWLHLE